MPTTFCHDIATTRTPRMSSGQFLCGAGVRDTMILWGRSEGDVRFKSTLVYSSSCFTLKGDHTLHSTTHTKPAEEKASDSTSRSKRTRRLPFNLKGADLCVEISTRCVVCRMPRAPRKRTRKDRECLRHHASVSVQKSSNEARPGRGV